MVWSRRLSMSAIFKTGSRQCKRQVSIGAKTGIVRCGKL